MMPRLASSPSSFFTTLLGGVGLVVACAATALACSADGETSSPPGSVNAGDDAAVTLPDAGAPADALDAAPDAPPQATCGNGKVEAPEACDDGNLQGDDGCSATCQLEAAFDGDVCPGKTIVLAKSSVGSTLSASITGSTKGAFNHDSSACGGGSGKDVVYTFTPASSGKAIVTLTADYAAIVSARSTCDVATSESKCSDISAPAGGTTKMEVAVFANTPTYLLVDGYGGSSGTFTLDIDVSEAVCGNGIAELPEACDDGNTANGDGCSSTCAVEDGGVINQCPGQPFLLSGTSPTAARKISFAGNTLTEGQQTQNSTGCFYQGGSNVVYALKSDVSGSAKATLTSGYAKANVHARSDCGASSFQLGCTQIEAPGAATIVFPVVANQWFYVFADGHRDGSKDYAGPFSLEVVVTPGACGNGAIDGSEQCDDGNVTGGDGCSASCTREAFADEKACPGHPLALAPQGDGSRTLSVSSATAINGKGVIDACGTLQGSSGDEAIYAVTPDIDGLLHADVMGAFNSTVSILSACTAKSSVLACSWDANASTTPFKLDGLGSIPKHVVTPVHAGSTYFVVVDASSSSGLQSGGVFKLDLSLTPAVCGNGVVEGMEQCDDGGTAADDGCDPTCKLEPITSRSSCGDAEPIALAETAPASGVYRASLARGTANLLSNANFFTSSLDDDKPCWAPGKNAFFAITAPASGVLRAVAKSTAFDIVLGLRKPACALSGPAFACANDSTKGSEEALATPIASGETVWLVVDSKTNDAGGRFDLDVEIAPSGCGDGFFVSGGTEECDDGNATNGDGCSSTCKLEAAVAAGVDTCPGKTLALSTSGVGGASKQQGTITFSTASLDADYSGACGGSARDGVVHIVPAISGVLRAKMRGMPNATVYARTICNDPSSELFKSSASTCPSVIHDTVTFSVTAGADYYVFVDGLDGATGVPTLDVTISP